MVASEIQGSNSNSEKYDRHFSAWKDFNRKLESKFRISAFELVFVLSFVINFITGKVIHLTSQEEEVHNYFNEKGNVFNQWFVKRGWGWTTVVLIGFYAIILLSNRFEHASREEKSNLLKMATLRYVVATIWWVFFTQWFFGLPIMDKVFVWTGGKCVNILEQDTPDFATNIKQNLLKKLTEELSYESNAITSYTCRKLKGSWIGGHDPSGHVFLMIHSSLYLFFETLIFWPALGETVSSFKQLKRQIASSKDGKIKSLTNFVLDNPHALVILLICLWWFMLLMTNIYFHSIAEKFVGLVFGYLANLSVYYAPRFRSKSATIRK